MVLPENQSSRTKLQAPNLIQSQIKNVTGLACQSRPGDVSKLLSSDPRHSGAPTESGRRMVKIFFNACYLYGVDVEARPVMCSLMETGFLRGLALLFAIDEVVLDAQIPGEAIQMLE